MVGRWLCRLLSILSCHVQFALTTILFDTIAHYSSQLQPSCRPVISFRLDSRCAGTNTYHRNTTTHGYCTHSIFWRRICLLERSSAGGKMHSKIKTPQRGSMQILTTLRTFCVPRREIIGTPAFIWTLYFTIRINQKHVKINSRNEYLTRKTCTHLCNSESLNHLRDAVDLWNSMDVDFAISLGDLIDGQNSGTYGQGNQYEQLGSLFLTSLSFVCNRGRSSQIVSVDRYLRQ